MCVLFEHAQQRHKLRVEKVEISYEKIVHNAKCEFSFINDVTDTTVRTRFQHFFLWSNHVWSTLFRIEIQEKSVDNDQLDSLCLTFLWTSRTFFNKQKYERKSVFFSINIHRWLILN